MVYNDKIKSLLLVDDMVYSSNRIAEVRLESPEMPKAPRKALWVPLDVDCLEAGVEPKFDDEPETTRSRYTHEALGDGCWQVRRQSGAE